MYTDAEIDAAMRAFVEGHLAPWAQVDYSRGFPVLGTSNLSTTRFLVQDTGFPLKGLTAEQIYRLWRQYRLFRFEENPAGELILSPTKGAYIGRLTPAITAQIFAWHKRYPFGQLMGWGVFFTLPDGAIVMPQISWMSYNRLSLEKAAPEFVIELRSEEEEMDARRAWVRHLLANGTQLAWLIDPHSREVEIYQPGKPVRKRHHPKKLDASPVLPGFSLDLPRVLRN